MVYWRLCNWGRGAEMLSNQGEPQHVPQRTTRILSASVIPRNRSWIPSTARHHWHLSPSRIEEVEMEVMQELPALYLGTYIRNQKSKSDTVQVRQNKLVFLFIQHKYSKLFLTWCLLAEVILGCSMRVRQAGSSDTVLRLEMSKAWRGGGGGGGETKVNSILENTSLPPHAAIDHHETQLFSP